MLSNSKQLSFFVDNIPPRRGHDRPRRVPVDEEAASFPQGSPPQGDPQFPSKFSISPMPQPGFFPIMTPKAFQAYTNCWYAQAQAQAQAGEGQYPIPPMATFAQPIAQSIVKLFKFVKKAR